MYLKPLMYQLSEKFKNNLHVSQVEKPDLNHYVLNLTSGFHLHCFAMSPSLVRFTLSQSEILDFSNQFIEHQNFDYLAKQYIFEMEPEYSDNEVLAFQFKTDDLLIHIQKHDLSIKIMDHARNVLFCCAPEHKDYPSCNTLINPANPPIIYGLGDKTGPINKWGRQFKNDPNDALGHDSEKSDPLYKDIPFWISLDRQSQIAHGIFFDNLHKKAFDFSQSDHYNFCAAGDILDFYFIAGPQISEVLANYLNLTGKPPLFPKFCFGYLASGMSYTEQDHSSQKILDMLETAERKDVGASAFHLSSGYIKSNEGDRLQFVWNRDKFTNPREFISKAQNINPQMEFCANVKPGFLVKHPWFDKLTSKGFFIGKNGSNTEPLIADYWGGDAALVDFRSEETQHWWANQLEEQVLAQGIRGIWNDNNEYELNKFRPGYGREMLQVLLMSKIAYETSLSHFAYRKRPWVLSRSGYSGIQKYAQTWTGDNQTKFHSLQYDIALVSTMSISGLIHTGADVGGFYGDMPSSELLLRWVQNGVFMPRFCIHSWKDTPTEPWLYETQEAEHFEIIQHYMQLRGKLLPYIYQANYQAHHQAKPIQRLTAYDYQDDPNCYEQSFDYLFGDSFLVAPVYEAGAKSRKVYLPKGNQWIDWATNQEHSGGQQLDLPVSLASIPVFIKANSFVPMQRDNETLDLRIFLASDFDGELDYEFYDDDGDSLDFQSNGFARFHFKLSKQGQSYLLQISKQAGDYQSSYKKMSVTVIQAGKKYSQDEDFESVKHGVLIN